MEGEGETRREVIAHFWVPAILFCLAICVGLVWMLFVEWQDLFHTAVRRHRHDTPFTLLLIFVSFVYFAVVTVRLAWAAIANRGEALWIEGGRLVYAWKGTLDVSLRDVVSADVIKWDTGKILFARYINRIVFRVRGGKSVYFEPIWFVEYRDDIVSSVREKAGLPVAS